MRKRFLSAFLVLTMMLTLIPAMSFSSSAEDAENPSETIAFNDRETAESEHFTLKGYPLWGGWLIESYTIAGHDVTITAKDPNTVILGIDAVVEAYGDRYNTVKYSSGEKLETDPVEDGSTVHVTNINSDKLVINCQYDFRIKDFTIYYTHKHSFTGVSKDNGDGTHSKKCSSADCSVYSDPQEHTYKPVAKVGDDPLIFTAKCTDCTSTIHNYQIENKTFTYTGSINYEDVEKGQTLKGGTKLKANYSLGDADMIVYIDGKKAADVKEGEYWVASQCVECVDFTSNWFSTDPLQIWFKSICEYTIASCETPETCMYCGHTKGEPLGHSFEGNTCTFCGKTKCEINGHTFENNTCTVCGLDEFVIEDGLLIKYNGNGRDVVIPDGVTSIGKSVFEGCENLTSVKIPDGVTSIGEAAFMFCEKLENVTLPDGVTSIGISAFNYSGLKSITIPENVTSIGNSAFSECSELISVTLPNGLKSIENETFFNCLKLTNVNIPDSVESIGTSAFENCTGLKSVIIPNNVKSLGICAFNHCENIESITISDNVTDMGARAFDECNKLTDVFVSCDSNIQAVKTIMQSYGNYKYTQFEHNFVDGVCTSCGIAEFVIKDGVLVAYNGNGGDVVIPDGVTSIGEAAFMFCEKLENVTLPDGVTSIGISAFNYSGLKSITIPESVTSIGNSAFSECSELISVTLPNGLKSIENETFFNCLKLTNVNIPDSVESIGTSAFENCTGLKSVIIPNNVKNLGICAFNHCENIESITISDNVTDMGVRAFDECNKLTDVFVSCDSNIQAVKTIMQSYGNFTYTKLDHDFKDNECQVCGAPEFDIKNGVLYAYNGKGGDVVIPDGVTEIRSAFQDTSITSVTIPNSVTKIGAKAFENCMSLTSVVIPCSVKRIGDFAFSNCTNLASITISGNVVTDVDVFDNCESLTNIYCFCDSDVESVKEFMDVYNTSDNFIYTQLDHNFVDGTCTVCGLDEFVIEYGLLIEYNGKGGDIVIPDGVTGINDCAFSEREDITSVTIPDSVKSIDAGAFEDCTNLISVTLPNGLKAIENETFMNCINLKNVTIPDSVESIGDSAFGNCTGLKNVIIPNSVKSIGVCAFNYCKGIESITISDNVTEIKAHAFWYCENLEDVYVFCDSNIYAVKKLMQSFGDYTYIQLDHNFADGVCTACGERNKISGISVKNGAQLTDDGEMIYGLDCGLNSAEDYFDITDNSLSLSYNKDVIGTGAHINIERDGKIIAYYVAVIFGDVNGDGWYDGMDSVIVNCLSNGLLSKEQVGEAVYMAADCNHDDVIDETDVAILEKAGALLSGVDQSKSPEELQSDSAYIEYINLIDQLSNVDEGANGGASTDEPTNSEINVFRFVINLIVKIINYLKLHLALLK